MTANNICFLIWSEKKHKKENTLYEIYYIALAKGRLAKKAMEMLELAGITCEEMKDETSRKLIL